MKNKEEGRGRGRAGGLIERKGLINFPPLKKGGGGGLKRGFMVSLFI